MIQVVRKNKGLITLENKNQMLKSDIYFWEVQETTIKVKEEKEIVSTNKKVWKLKTNK